MYYVPSFVHVDVNTRTQTNLQEGNSAKNAITQQDHDGNDWIDDT